jgi:hypothetical protein
MAVTASNGGSAASQIEPWRKLAGGGARELAEAFVVDPRELAPVEGQPPTSPSCVRIVAASK